MKRIYLDNAAATPIDPRVKIEIVRSLKLFGNPSSFNDTGREAAGELKKARLVVARFLGAHPEEIVFTSSGSEANNLAIEGVSANHRSGVFVSTKIEHLSVLEALKKVENRGGKVVFLRNDGDGCVDPAELNRMISPDIVLVSVMYANNEVGTIQPIVQMGKVIRDFRKKRGVQFPLFHVDACQAAGLLNMKVNALGADLVTFNGSKINGPRGIGVLYVRKGIKLESLIVGGGQENGLRAGTENLSAILGLAKAVSLINKTDAKKQADLRDHFIRRLGMIIPEAKINGPSGDKRLANNINFSIPDLDSENILLELDKYGISGGSGSACTARSVEPSHVLQALEVEERYLSGAIRLSLGRGTIKKDIEYVLDVLPRIKTVLEKRYKKD